MNRPINCNYIHLHGTTLANAEDRDRATVRGNL